MMESKKTVQSNLSNAYKIYLATYSLMSSTNPLKRFAQNVPGSISRYGP